MNGCPARQNLGIFFDLLDLRDRKQAAGAVGYKPPRRPRLRSFDHSVVGMKLFLAQWRRGAADSALRRGNEALAAPTPCMRLVISSECRLTESQRSAEKQFPYDFGKSGALNMGGSRSGRYGSGRPIAEGLRRFDLAEYMRGDGVKPNGSSIATIRLGKISAEVRYTETATRFGGRRVWALCPRCSRRCRVLYIGLGRIACRRCFRLRYLSQSMDQADRALHAMTKIAKKIDPEAPEMDLPDKPPGMHWSRYNRLAERFDTRATCGT